MRTEVLHQQLLLGEDASFLADEGPPVLERLVCRGVKETNAVEVVAAGLVGNQDLDLFDRGIVGHLEGRGKLLDGLLGGSVREFEDDWRRHDESFGMPQRQRDSGRRIVVEGAFKKHKIWPGRSGGASELNKQKSCFLQQLDAEMLGRSDRGTFATVSASAAISPVLQYEDDATSKPLFQHHSESNITGSYGHPLADEKNWTVYGSLGQMSRFVLWRQRHFATYIWGGRIYE